MSDNANEPLGQGLLYEAPLPMRCTPAADWDADRLAYAAEQNERVLQALRVLDEYALSEAGEEGGAVAQELARLDAKLNLMLDLVNQLLTRHLDLPPPRAVALGSQGLSWHTDAPPAVGDAVVVELYLNVRYPVPLVLQARVASVGAGRPAPVEVSFEYLKDNVQEWLERIIFRHHRRQIAEARRGVN